MNESQKPEQPALSKPEARVLLSIKKNLTYINVANLQVDWPDCDGNKQDWEAPLRMLTRYGHIEAFEQEFASGGKVALTKVDAVNFAKRLVFRLSPTGDGLLAKAQKVAEGEPRPTLVHNILDGTWTVIR